METTSYQYGEETDDNLPFDYDIDWICQLSQHDRVALDEAMLLAHQEICDAKATDKARTSYELMLSTLRIKMYRQRNKFK
jgi:hypothetical protein